MRNHGEYGHGEMRGNFFDAGEPQIADNLELVVTVPDAPPPRAPVAPPVVVVARPGHWWQRWFHRHH